MKKLLVLLIILSSFTAIAFASETDEALPEATATQESAETQEPTATQESTETTTPETTPTQTPTPSQSPKPAISAEPLKGLVNPEIKPIFGFDPSNSLHILSDIDEVEEAIKTVFEENGGDASRITVSLQSIKVSNRRALVSVLETELSGRLTEWYDTEFLIKDTSGVTRAEFCHILDAIANILKETETPPRIWGGEYMQVYSMKDYMFPHGMGGVQFIPTRTDKKINDSLVLETNTWTLTGTNPNKVPEKFSYLKQEKLREFFIIGEVIEIQTLSDGKMEYTGYGTTYGGIGPGGIYLHITIPEG